MRQLHQTKRRLCLGALVLVVTPMLLASVAYACTQLTNLTASPSSGAAGVTITVTGSNYNNSSAAGPVEIRMDSRTGPVLASLPTASINPNGRTISIQVPIPSSAAIGYHTLLATQRNNATGALLGGFPVRATYDVTAAAATKEGSTQPLVASTRPVPSPPDAAPAAAGNLASPPAPAAPPAAPGQVAPAPATAPAANAVAPSGAASAGPASVDPGASPATGTPPAAPGTDVAATATAATPSDSGGPHAARTTAAAAAETVTGTILTAAAGDADGLLPQLTLALGAAVLLLSLFAVVKSGHSVLAGRRTTPA